MSSSKKRRRRSIFEAANAVFRGTTIRTYDRSAIKAKVSEHPAIFDSVVKMYGSDTVVQIISSLLDNGKIALESYAHLELAKTRQLSTVRKRQHDALEQEAAKSEAKALDEATRSDLAMHEGDQDGEQIDVAGDNLCCTINDLANVYEKKPDRSKTLLGPIPPNRHLCFPHTCRILLSISY